jgi:signal transduction histidine kinase
VDSDRATLLIAEDDTFTRTSMTAYLKAEGFAVEKAANGVEALEIARNLKVDLVVTDLNMPEMDGMELLRILSEEFPEIPVIIVSGVGTVGSVIEALRVGAKDYLQKPIEDMELLKHSIGRALSHTQLKNENKEYQENLELLVEKRTAEVWDKNLELKKLVEQREQTEAQLLQAQKLESVGQLASGIAHEINTPTQFVSSNVDFLDESFKDMLELVEGFTLLVEQAKNNNITPELLTRTDELVEELELEYLIEEIPKAISQSREGVQRIATIVNAMKEFSHPGSRAMTAIDLNRVIETTVVVARNEWKYVANLETDLDPELQPTSCLSDEIGQVFLNIIVNAAHAIESKLGENPDGEKGLITITTRQIDGAAEIVITDSGSGIPEHARHRIFDPFYTTKKVGKGTGQGLGIAHAVVTNKHHGSISFETTSGEGTSFKVRLPQKER